MLGGSPAQLIAIEKARQLGYHTVVCDYLPDNPGQYIADKFYLESTTDKDAILEIARKEGIEGIVAYSSDPAAPTAAYVAEALHLPGNSYDMVRSFCEKHLFREFLIKNGFAVPESIEIKVGDGMEEAVDLSTLRFPVIVKPTDSSGSKGVTVLQSPEGLKDAMRYAGEYSRNKTLIVEEFIERDHPYVIEAEIFAIDGEVVSWGLINSIRDEASNPLLPAAYTYPLEISPERKKLVRQELERLVKATGNTSGAFNIEMIIDKEDRLFFLDAGPRNGGNMLPEFISMISGKDIVAATVRNAMGENDRNDVFLDGETGGYWGLGILHSDRDGLFAGIEYSQGARQALVREVIQKRPGEKVHAFERCNDLVGLNFYRFDSPRDMEEVMCHPYNSMKVTLA